MSSQHLNRRRFLAASAAASASALAAPSLLRAAEASKSKVPLGKADHCIMIWLGGGFSQIDTFDPKQLGNPEKKQAGSYYPKIATAVKGVEVTEHLAKTANLMDRFTAVRTVHHEVIDEHAAAVNRMHTGRPTSGAIVYPSIGSIVAACKGDATASVPSYVVAGYPNLTRGPGFLGAQHSYMYLIDTDSGPVGLTRPDDIPDDRAARRQALLGKLEAGYTQRIGPEKAVAAYSATSDKAFRLSGQQFMDVFNLKEESKSLRESYGEEFGQRCLLARRLVQAGVSFVEVSHNLNFVNGTGWDVHNKGILNQHVLIKQLDAALSTLTTDLERCKMLDKTLIVVAGEFGRPGHFDGGGGRGHHGKSFTVVLGGGGLNHMGAYGQTNEFAEEIVSDPVGVPDVFATVFNALGIKPSKTLYDGDRPVPITDMGAPIAPLFS
ncbi:MAG: DUF1501 domain-containing protein [Planctomycetes bacterium]|nr:DUF1501 domain-containing protein [Planctomycetota bacterium]